MRPVRSIARALTLALVLPVLTGVVPARPAAAAGPEGQATWAVHIALAPTWFDPAETSGIITPFMVLYAMLIANHAYSAPYEDLRLKQK